MNANEHGGKLMRALQVIVATLLIVFAAPGLLAAERRESPKAPANSEEAVAQAKEFRIFLTDRKGVVRGEIETARSAVRAISIDMEKGRVLFRDDGSGADKKAGDGVYSAEFSMDTDALFARVRKNAKDVGRGKFIRRGPRDIVSIDDKSLKTTMSDTALRRFATISEAPSSDAAARSLGVDIRSTPFIRLPGPSVRGKIPLIFGTLIPQPFPPVQNVTVDWKKSLLLSETSVVDDPARTFDVCTGQGTKGGAWTFAHLMREMSQGSNLSPEDFTMYWLANWQINQTVNGWTVSTARGANIQSQIIDAWTALSPGGIRDINFFPARLAAIVNRPDLADKIGYSTAGSAGEGRFVFHLMTKSGSSCQSIPFTVIFEYGIAGGSCSIVKAWHQRWKNLETSSNFNADLELITRDFTDAGKDPAQSPNQNALNQLRTNEIALGSPWQLQEFRLGSTGKLDMDTVKQTPDLSLLGAATLNSYLQAAEQDILAGAHIVPDRFPTMINPFLGAVSDTPFGHFWTIPSPGAGFSNPAETRRKFSLNTCNACHAGETATPFLHISRPSSGATQLSGFLIGQTIPEPVTGTPRTYNDLAERTVKMEEILENPCFVLAASPVFKFVH